MRNTAVNIIYTAVLTASGRSVTTTAKYYSHQIIVPLL